MPEHRFPPLAAALLIAAMLLPGAAAANLRGFGLSQPVELGTVMVRWLGLPIYRASLHTEGESRFGWRQPLALQIEYFRSISQDDLTKSTRVEIQRIEGPRADQAAMMQKLASCFRDVARGDVFTAVSTQPDSLVLHLNGQQTCAIRHPDLRKRFLGIWLSDNSRSARLSARLRGD